MRSLSVCMGCCELEKTYDCEFVGGEIVEKRLASFRCMVADKRIITRQWYYESKTCPKECRMRMEQMVVSQKHC